MLVSEKTISELAGKGIEIKWWPDESREAFRKRMWQKEYDYAYNYSKDNVRGSKAIEEGYTNELYASMEEFEEHCRNFANNFTNRACSPYEYTTLYVTYDNGRKTFLKKENVKSKEITPEYVEKLVEKNDKAYNGAYGEFAIKMQALLKENGLSSLFSIYPTTYGIGVWIFYNFHADDNIELVTKILDDKGIEYYNEFSDKHFVYRYKVSKKKENLERI